MLNFKSEKKVSFYCLLMLLNLLPTYGAQPLNLGDKPNQGGGSDSGAVVDLVPEINQGALLDQESFKVVGEIFNDSMTSTHMQSKVLLDTTLNSIMSTQKAFSQLISEAVQDNSMDRVERGKEVLALSMSSIELILKKVEQFNQMQLQRSQVATREFNSNLGRLNATMDVMDSSHDQALQRNVRQYSAKLQNKRALHELQRNQADDILEYEKKVKDQQLDLQRKENEIKISQKRDEQNTECEHLLQQEELRKVKAKNQIEIEAEEQKVSEEQSRRAEARKSQNFNDQKEFIKQLVEQAMEPYNGQLLCLQESLSCLKSGLNELKIQSKKYIQNLSLVEPNIEQEWEESIKTDNLEKVKDLLEDFNMDLNKGVGEYAMTPLCIAAKHCSLRVLQMLIQKGVDIEKTDKEGNTPLHIAAKHNRPEVVRILIQENAEANKANNRGWTPLQVAQLKANRKVVNLLGKKLSFIFRLGEIAHNFLHGSD